MAGDGSGLNGAMSGNQRVLKLSSLWLVDAQTTLNVGVDTQYDTYTATGDNAFDMKRTLQGVFAGLNRQWERLTLQLNARHDRVDTTNTASGADSQNSTNTGLLGLGWRLNSHWRLTSAVSSGFRAPTAFDVSQNANLKPEKHRSQEVGLVHTTENSLSKLVYFESFGRDVIDYTPTYATENIGEIRNKGWEATSQSNWGPYKLRVSAVLQDPWSVTHQEPLSRRAKHYGSADVSRQWQGVDVGARVVAAGERKNSHYDTYAMGGYAVWSLYVSRRLDAEWSAHVKFDNAFDRQYQLAHGYNTPGRGLYATLRYQPKP
jgi:vitamin B12 transporter